MSMMDDFSAPNPTLPNAQDLAYFAAMQEANPPGRPDHSAQMWNQRAEAWKKERTHQRKGDERVISAVAYLEKRGILRPESDVVDIGCGPGRFVVAFAKRVHHVVGLDISDKMVEHGMEHVREVGLTNAVLRICDFQTLDIEREGYKGAFDLVFSSMTPAIHGMGGLMKSMEMSRGWCYSINHLGGSNSLSTQIAREVFDREVPARWASPWFYSLFNVLFLMGYNPETSYETLRREIWIQPDEAYAKFLMGQILTPEEASADNEDKIMAWLKYHANEDGLVQAVSEASYGSILWNVKDKTERPNYFKPDQGV